MKRVIALVTAVVTALIFVMIMVVGWSVGRGAGVASGPASGSKAILTAVTTKPHFYLVIAKGEQLDNEPLGPAYLPSAFTLPANTDVTLTITNFDSPTALAPNAAKYVNATGIDHNTFQTGALDPKDPNARAATTKASAVDPTVISHTFTIPKLNLNVPITATSTVTFSFHTPDAGTVGWRCMDPCGIGPLGWDGAMSTNRYMQGQITFA